MRVRPFTGTFYGTSAFSDSQTVPTSKRGLLYLGRILTVDSEICGKCGTIVETCEPTISKRKQAELSISKKNIMFFWFKDSESMGMRQSPLPERTLCSFFVSRHHSPIGIYKYTAKQKPGNGTWYLRGPTRPNSKSDRDAGIMFRA